MRQFVILGHEAPVDPEFSLDDLAGGAGRLDALCRCVNAAFCLSHAIREDVRLFLVLRDEVTLRFEGADLRYLSPDERNIASLIREALDAKSEAVGHREVESTPGIHVSTRGLEPVLDRLRGTVIQLHADGEPVVETEPPADPAFVLSDHRSFTDREADRLAARADRRVSLGPRALHGDDAVTVAHNYLDTDGFRSY
jgi:tRNA (pseudouridine54-N1)-methyltransferase